MRIFFKIAVLHHRRHAYRNKHVFVAVVVGMLTIHDDLSMRHCKRYDRSLEITYVTPPLEPFYHDATIDYLGNALVQLGSVLPDYRI
jgi:hypothetical protein